MSRYFFGESSGVNSDIERHRKAEAKLRERLAKAEEETDQQMIKIYTYFLGCLLDSKAQVVSKIGRGKKTK